MFPLDMGPHEGHKLKLYFSGGRIMFFSSKYDSVMNYFHNRKWLKNLSDSLWI